MAKSLRSKIMRRWRKLKRGHLDEVVMKPKLEKISNNLSATILGMEYREKEAKNAYLHPQEPDAQFPQVKPAPIIDLRSTSIPGSGREWSGANRKGNKTVTESFQNYDGLMAEEPEEEQKEEKEVKKPETMRDETDKLKASSYKAKKLRKSRLRRTIVF